MSHHRPPARSLVRTLSLAALVAAVLLPAGCGDDTAKPRNAGGATAATLPAGLFATSEPAGALKVLDARKSAKPGERVTVIGRIGGSRAPFVSTKAIFTMVDPTLKSCVEMGDHGDDHCPRPWDYCCEGKSEVSKAVASIEVVGADGKPLPIALNSTGELKPLMLVAVEGTLQSDASGAFVVRADKIYKFPNDPLAKHIK